MENTHFWVGPWRIDPELNKISTSEKSVTVEPRAMRTLCYLHKRRGHPVSRDELLDKVWGKQALTDHAISVVIVSLRQALGDDAQNPKYLKTIRKKGYCLDEAVDVEEARLPVDLGASTHDLRKTSIGIAAVSAALFIFLLLYVAFPKSSDSIAAPFVISFSPVVQTETVDAILTTVTNDLLVMELARYGQVVEPDRALQIETSDIYRVSASVIDEAGHLVVDMVAENSDGIRENMTVRSQTNILAMAASVRSLVATMMAGRRVIAPKSETRNDVEIILDRARYFWGFHRHDRNQLAYRMVKKLLKEHPANGDVHALLAEMYAALPGRVWGLDGVDTLALAEQHIQRAVELGADAKYVWRTQARLLHERDQDYIQAAKFYRKALDHDPEDYWNWRNFAVSLAVSSRFEEAIAAHDRAISLSLEPTGALSEKMVTLYFAGQFDAAAKLKKELQELDGRPGIRAALIYYMAGDHEASFAEWAQYFERLGLRNVADIFNAATGVDAIAGVYANAASLLKAMPEGRVAAHLIAYVLFAADDVDGGSEYIQKTLDLVAMRRSQPNYDPRSTRMLLFMRIDPFFKRFEKDQLVQNLLRAMDV